ncbi:MAG: hypothetical protein IK140_07505 [Clostridia bacterium]|nr:hypothetical protein [Clostridia bacterium]
MAKIDLKSIKESLSKRNFFSKGEEENFDEPAENEYEEDYVDEAGEEDYSADTEEYEDAGDEYADDGEYADEDGEYTDEDGEYADEDGYEEYDEDGEYADEDGDEDYGDEEEYDEDGYDEEEYDEDEEDLGYNPAVFSNLDGEDDVDPQYQEYDDEPGDDEPVDGEPAAGSDWMNKVKGVLNNEYVIYALCALIPLLAIYLLWRHKKFDTNKRWILTALAGVFLIIWMIICWPSSGANDETDPNVPDWTPSFTSTPTQAPASSQQPSEPTAEPSPTTHVNPNATANPDAASTYVWTTNANIYYHTVPDCDGLTNTTQRTLESAVQQGKLPCPTCAGGTNNYADPVANTTFYATKNGKWYHTDPVCQGMTGASQVTEANAISAGKTACPVCIGYYGTPNGSWYHVISNCQGMTNAITKPESEWKAQGKTACPVCILKSSGVVNGSTIPNETQVYCTSGGVNFHVLQDCRGMKGASQVSISTAVKSGKTACKYCMLPAKVYVFANKDGTYYHTRNDCSGMKNAQYVTAKAAASAGKKACPKCNAAKLFSYGSASTDFGSSAVNLANSSAANTASALNGKTTTDTATYVYATKNGTYYHTKSNCSGMKGATRGTYAAAVKSGKKPCPTCVNISSLSVFATTGGKYFHTSATCSGMTGALSVSVSKALSAGKTACPTCAKGLSTMGSAKSASAAATTPPATAAAGNTNVYITLGAPSGSYYHKTGKCSGQNFSGGQNVTLEYALEHGYKACPSCNPPSKIST